MKYDRKQVKIYDNAPDGFRIDQGTTTAPIGTDWWTNGKSHFGGERINVLVKNRHWDEMKKQERR